MDDKYFEFIEKHIPTFEKSSHGFKMFTTITQWCERKSIKELLDYGLTIDDKFNGKSPYCYLTSKSLGDVEVLEFKTLSDEDYKKLVEELESKTMYPFIIDETLFE